MGRPSASRDVDRAGLTVRVDQLPVVRKEWSAIPIQPGLHELVVEGDGVETWRTTFGVEAAPKRLVVVVPPLSRRAERDSPPPAEAMPVAAPPQSKEQTAAGVRMRRLRYGMLGVGIAGIVAGAITGGLAIRQRAVVKDHRENKLCDRRGMRAADRGDWLANASTVSYAVGGVGVAGWLFVPGGLLHPRERQATLQGRAAILSAGGREPRCEHDGKETARPTTPD